MRGAEKGRPASSFFENCPISSVLEPEDVVRRDIQRLAELCKGIQSRKLVRRAVLRDHFGGDADPLGDFDRRQTAVDDFFPKPLFDNTHSSLLTI